MPQTLLERTFVLRCFRGCRLLSVLIWNLRTRRIEIFFTVQIHFIALSRSNFFHVPLLERASPIYFLSI